MFWKKTKYLNEFNNIYQSSESLAKWCFSYVKQSDWDMLQTKTSITKPIQKTLMDMYAAWWCASWIEFTFLNKYENINYEWTVVIENNWLNEAYQYLFMILSQHTPFIQFNKYRNYTIQDIKKWMVTFVYYDTLWNAKERTESALILKKYVQEQPMLKMFCQNNRNYIDNILPGNEITFTYKVTNNINDKLKVIKMNQQWGSCQWKTHWIAPRNYARWVYDFFNNGCIAPLIVYHEWKIVWRAAFRIFFDEEWKRYINLERMFWHWHLINNLQDFCRKLTEDLLKLNETLTISQQFSVTNTHKINPRFDSLSNGKNFNLERLAVPLRQPKRLINPKINQWYYQDSLIHTIYVEWQDSKQEYIYDCINPADEYALHIITLKDVSSKKA
jgi:hypothetical protein